MNNGKNTVPKERLNNIPLSTVLPQNETSYGKDSFKRIYEEPSEADGYRILLDRLWPRGLKKEDAKFDEWRKDITPSKELRQWFHEDKDRHWEVFQGRYGMEIKQNPDFIPFLREIEKHPVVTFLTAAKDVQHSHLPILKEVIEDFEKNKS